MKYFHYTLESSILPQLFLFAFDFNGWFQCQILLEKKNNIKIYRSIFDYDISYFLYISCWSFVTSKRIMENKI